MATPIQHASPQSNGVSPRAFAAQHARPPNNFRGCSRITDYDILGKLGEGTFGEVHRAKSKKTGTIVALKKILMHNEKDGFPITALREIKLLKLLSHPNVLKLEEMAVEHHSKSSTDKRKRAIMYMVTPYMDHDLSGLLENPSVKFTEPQIKCYMLQLLEGLRYLHDNKILHRDMKAANLLINNKGILQIADFGLARHYDEPVPVAGHGGGEAHRDYTTLVVTRWYRPPELLLHLRKYTTAIDLWGVGCVFGEMLVGKPILSGDSDPNQLKIIFDLVGTPTEETMPGWKSLPGAEGLSFPTKSSSLWSRFSSYGSGAISLLSDLLKLDWRKRVNAIDALKHPYFHTEPLPARAGDLPTFEDSHELDRRKFRGQKAAPPPAPKGGTVGMVLGLLTGATVVIVNTTEVAILKAGIEMVSHHLLLKKSADLHGDGMMAVHQDYHPDHRLWIIMMEDWIVQRGIDLTHEKLTAHRKETEWVHRTWTRIYPVMVRTVPEETIDEDGMTVTTVGTMIEESGNVIED
ncbi:Serine/threonine-protein kinase [Lachnellula subtilissima]|uniref:Serine/threonine-protein kinase BUR1 n=1 Tax=Lachnellula subtilissima TaxID=602034 RepID=A0A8H8UEG2_9HELO|nr:Serine/threonine-protein kinase [Lachnellula subtilissima]